jgi:hypothetical protein
VDFLSFPLGWGFLLFKVAGGFWFLCQMTLVCHQCILHPCLPFSALTPNVSSSSSQLKNIPLPSLFHPIQLSRMGKTMWLEFLSEQPWSKQGHRKRWPSFLESICWFCIRAVLGPFWSCPCFGAIDSILGTTECFPFGIRVSFHQDVVTTAA